MKSKFTLLVLFAALVTPWAMQAQSVKKDVARNATTQLVKTGAKTNAGPATVIHAPKALTISDPTTASIPTDVTAEPTATTADVAWTPGENNDGWNLRYREYMSDTGTSVSWDFEQSTLDGWTTIDADGDGYGWVLGSAEGGVYISPEASAVGIGHSPQDMVASGSYSNIVGVLHPDNYLVSPKVQLGGKITFWAKGQDVNYAAETFGVAVSTTDNTNPDSFTMVGEKQTATAEWVQYEFDLSAYAGQEGYVAIRHYDISDMFVLNVDDIEILPAGADWIELDDVTNPFTIEGLTPETTYEVQVMAFNNVNETEWTESTLFTTLAEVPIQGIEELYMVGTFNDWNQTEDGGRLELVEVEEGVFEVEAELAADAEFKFITPAEDGGWIWFGGIDEAQVGYFLVTEELYETPISLIDGANFHMQNAGKFIFRVRQARSVVRPLVLEVVPTNPTAIVDLNTKTQDNTWYNIQGMKLQGVPTAAGIYINGGKKVVIK